MFHKFEAKMLTLISLFCAALLFAGCQSLALDYNENAIMQIGDLTDLENNNTVLVQSIDSIKRLQELHPQIAVQELNVLSNAPSQMVYTLGARSYGDRMVGTSSKNQSWPRPQNVSIQLTYPSQGVGALVTYVYIVVNQSTRLGRAYVVRGGLHQRFITIVVEAFNTTYANYHAEIFGI